MPCKDCHIQVSGTPPVMLSNLQWKEIGADPKDVLCATCIVTRASTTVRGLRSVSLTLVVDPHESGPTFREKFPPQEFGQDGVPVSVLTTAERTAYIADEATTISMWCPGCANTRRMFRAGSSGTAAVGSLCCCVCQRVVSAS